MCKPLLSKSIEKIMVKTNLMIPWNLTTSKRDEEKTRIYRDSIRSSAILSVARRILRFRRKWLKLIHKRMNLYAYRGIVYSWFLSSSGVGGSRRFLKVKSIMHEGPRAKPNSLSRKILRDVIFMLCPVRGGLCF